MDTKQWKYKIGTGKTPVFLSLVMVILFGSLSIWLHKNQNGAYVFCDILTIIMVAVLITTVHRLFFYKILIGRDGFYYQTRISNGRYYNYAEIRKAWISSGTNLSGHETEYCNIETPDGNMIRFIFYFADTKGVEYLIKRVETIIASRVTEESERRHEYRIDGKAQGKASLIIPIVAAALVCVFDAPVLMLGGIYILPGVVGLGMAAYILIASLFSYFCYQIKIEEKGFYYQTNPFNGTYIKYQDITRCWDVLKVYRYWRSPDRTHYYYLYFTDRSGKTRRFQFSKDIYEHEINVLKERIGG